MDDIYFITGLSRRGEVASLRSHTVGGGITILDYIAWYCLANTRTVGIQVPINAIVNMSMNIIVDTLVWIMGSKSLRQASRPVMFYASQCMQPIVFDWCTTLLGSMKTQLTECKERKDKKFGYGSILCSFFFERVPGLSSRVDVPPHSLRNLALTRWAEILT